MAAVKTGRKRKVVIEAETVVTVVPGQGELFGGMPAETVTVTAAAPDPVEPVAVALPPDWLSAAKRSPWWRLWK